MKKGIGKVAVVSIALGAASLNVWATDVGMPLDSTDIGKSVSFEVYYEKYKRDIEITRNGDSVSGERKEDRFVLRMNYNAIERASFHVEAGLTDEDIETSDGAIPFLGIGLKFRAYDSEALDVTIFTSGTYVRGLKSSANGRLERSGRGYVEYPDWTFEIRYIEINGGFSVSRLIQLNKTTACTPYGGFMLSKLDGDEDFEMRFHRLEQTTYNGSNKNKEDGLFSIFAGVVLTLDETFGIKLEGRFVNQTSFSAGLMYYF